MANSDSVGSLQERTDFFYANLVGHIVHATVRDGTVYEGVFHSVQSQQDGAMALRCARVKKAATAASEEEASKLRRQAPVGMLSVAFRDLVEVSAAAVKLAEEFHEHAAFATDAEIGASMHAGQERELVAWVGGDDDDALEETFGTSSSGGWDQFAVNEQKFGVRSTFDEGLYTTALDRSSADYKKREREAARLAREITQQKGKGRGNNRAPVHASEEERFSSVLATGADAPNWRRASASPSAKAAAPAAVEGKAEEKGATKEAQAGKEEEEAEAEKKKKASSSFKFNPNAKAFNFNPGAKEFVPSFGGSPKQAPQHVPPQHVPPQQMPPQQMSPMQGPPPMMPVYPPGVMPQGFAPPMMGGPMPVMGGPMPVPYGQPFPVGAPYVMYRGGQGGPPMSPPQAGRGGGAGGFMSPPQQPPPQ